MYIYRVLKRDNFGGVTTDFWTTLPPEEAKQIKEGEQMDKTVLYAIEYDVEDSGALDFFHRIERLPIRELRVICEKDDFLKELVLARIAGGRR